MAKPGIELLGWEEAVRQFHRLDDAVAAKELRRATLRGATPVRAEARRRVRRKSGRLQKAIGIKARSFGRYLTEVSIGFDRRRAWYGGMIELGHRLVKGKKKRDKKVIGHVPAYPFLRPALDTQAKAAEERMREVFAQNISKVVARGRR